MATDVARYQHEREFWDARVAAALADSHYRYENPKLGAFEALAKQIEYLGPVANFFGDVRGKQVLDLACGDGWIALSLGKSGARVFGCDISPLQIEFGRRTARANGLGDVVSFEPMVCEELSYATEMFDAVIMHAALHHCDVDRTVAQVHRVLKPGGKAVFIEDYAYHPLMRIYRQLTPHGHTETEEALTDEDVARITERFSTSFCGYYGLVNLVETATGTAARRVRPYLRRVDRALYRLLPGLRRYSKLVSIFVVK